MFDAPLLTRATDVIATLRAARLHLATAESCTGGLIAALLTEIAGASDVVDCGFVTYSNEAKTALVGVPSDLIAQHGAVSREVAIAMATGALARTRQVKLAQLPSRSLALLAPVVAPRKNQLAWFTSRLPTPPQRPCTAPVVLATSDGTTSASRLQPLPWTSSRKSQRAYKLLAQRHRRSGKFPQRTLE